MIIEIVDVDADSEEEVEDIETSDGRRKARWQRVAQAATKQCLRYKYIPACQAAALETVASQGGDSGALQR